MAIRRLRPWRRFLVPLGAVLAAALLIPASVGAGAQTPAPADAFVPPDGLEAVTGRILIDGSSTVWPITVEAWERFRPLAPAVIADVEISGTGGGFRRFCAGGSDLQNASRPINKAEAAACAAAGVAYHAFEVGFDGITVVVNPANTWARCLTTAQLRSLWEPGSPVRTWRDLDPAWPPEPIDLYGPGPDSGTFDYFTEAIVGETGASRTDYTPSENDSVLVEGVAGDAGALGYFGFAYYKERADDLVAVAVDAGEGCVAPADATIADGSYRPLSRPLFVYVNDASLTNPAVREFMRFYVAEAPVLVAAVGYVPDDPAVYAGNRADLQQATDG